MRCFKIAVVFAFFLLALIPLASRRVSVLPEAQASEISPPPEAAAPADPADYVGSDSCSQCHGDQAAHFATTAHRKTLKSGAAPDKQGCEGCHGPAKKHVDYYLGAQDLIKAGKDAEAQALYADEA